MSIGYSGIEILNLPAGIGDLTLTTTAADDTVVVTPGLSTGANSGTVSSSGAVPQISFANSGSLTANSCKRQRCAGGERLIGWRTR